MRTVMMGTGSFAEPTFDALLNGPYPVVGLVTNPDRPKGRERDMVRAIKQMALDKSIPIFQPESINSPEGVAGLRAFQPDLLVVAAYGQILSREVLSIPSLGGINVHASLLPKYRGAAPIPWAIYHGETSTGVTIIKMSVHLDAGDMLAQEAIEIRPDDTAGALEGLLAPVGARLALEVMDRISQGKATGTKQDPARVTKAPKLTKDHGLIDWTRAAPAVANQVRAMQPWPTAYTFLHRPGKPPQRIIVYQAKECVREEPTKDESSSSGQALIGANPPDRLIVTAGNQTWVEIVELQPAGKRRMPASEFLHGHPLELGARFGPEAS